MTGSGAEKLSARLISAGSYPAVMALGLVLYVSLVALGWPVAVASYTAVLIGAALVTLHELKLPYRTDWRPAGREVRTDTLFMIVVQVGLPYLLSITLVLALADLLATNGITISGIWPHRLPVLVQAFVMLAAADFPRYWLHRAFHRFIPMWRFHAVHHSPHRLYWLNVGRFHPLEKAVQYLVDALPFALLAVAPDVLAAYFVFYALNGFYQHSNCKVRLGPLNYVVSGPELHRWHHSELVRESNNNYGNNLIIWDVLFGTRFLPKGRGVGPLGLPNRRYPAGFVSQMRTPFVAGIEK